MTSQSQSHAGQHALSAVPSLVRESPTGPETPVQVMGPARILAVDDNPINLEVLREQLRILGHAVDCAECGADALVKWTASDYRLLLVDCQMPVMDGRELALRIRQQEHQSNKHAPIRIIGWTGNATEENASACMAAGMDDLLTKPVTLRMLAEKLVRWLPPATSR